MELVSRLVSLSQAQANVRPRRLTVVEPTIPKPATESGKSVQPAFSAAEMRHHFAIWKLTTTKSVSGSHQLYFCTRCKWAFSVYGRRGLVTPLDADGNQLGGTVARVRLATFALGPCPVFGRLTQHSRLTQPVALIDNLGRRLLAPIFAGYRSMLAGVCRSVHRSSA